MSNKAELTVEFLPSDWLEASQVTGFVLIQIFETFSSEVSEEKRETGGESCPLLLGI